MEETLPERRRRQRQEALDIANQTRTLQAELKKRLRDGRVNPVVLLEGHDRVWSKFALELKVGVLLRSIPTFGQDTVREILHEVGLFTDDKLKHQSNAVRKRLTYLVGLVLARE